MSRSFPYLSEHERLEFPDPEHGTVEGIVAHGANLSPGVLLSAYEQGIFPWFSEGDPLLWWSPDPRFVLFPHELHVPRRLSRRLRAGEFSFTFDMRFEDVIRHCSEAPRPGQDGTWITSEMIEAYIDLHRRGYAHSVEVYQSDRLCGGLYGISLGRAFFGESMFSVCPDASKAAFVSLVAYLSKLDFHLIDCQVYTEHLERFGAREVSRKSFLLQLKRALNAGPGYVGDWGISSLKPRIDL